MVLVFTQCSHAFLFLILTTLLTILKYQLKVHHNCCLFLFLFCFVLFCCCCCWFFLVFFSHFNHCIYVPLTFSFPFMYYYIFIPFYVLLSYIHTILIKHKFLFRNMTKFNSSIRKIKQRKRKREENNLINTYIPSESSIAPKSKEPSASTAPPDPPTLETTKRRKTNQTEINKKKKIKYKLKKKQQKVNRSYNIKKNLKGKSHYLSTTRRWTWKTLKSSQFTLKQKKSLFKAHSISKIIEQNNATLYNLKSTLSNVNFKNNSGNITSSQQSSTNITPSATLEGIEYLEKENDKLKNIIFNIKATEKSEYQKRIRHLKKISSNHGYHLRKRIISLTNSLHNFLTHLQIRINLWNQNTALILERENLLSRQHLLIQEKENLSSSNKIHNFTSINLPSEFTELLNKGTNFIPTSDKINIIKKTISLVV